MQVFCFTPRSVLSRYTLMVIALFFCDGAQFTQTFCIHVFAEGCTYVSYDMKLSDLFPASKESVECKCSVLPCVPFYPALPYPCLRRQYS